jgi:hypothetical protein
MSVDVTKCYNRLFKTLVSKHGFKRNGVAYYKLNKTILQFIRLYKSSSGYSFTVNADILPLCDGIEEFQFKEGRYHIGYFKYGCDFYWDYYGANLDQIEKKVQEALEIVLESVLPFFDNVVDEESYLFHINELEKNIFGSAINDMLWVKLKLKKYDDVIKCIGNIEKQNYDAAAHNKILYENKSDYQKYLQTVEDDLTEIRVIKDAIEKKDVFLLDSIIKDNEEKSLRVLQKLGIYN